MCGGAGGRPGQYPDQRLPPGGGMGVDSGSPVPPPQVSVWQAGPALTSTLVMSQSLTALLCTPLVTIWKPLAVAVWSSTEDRWGRSARAGASGARAGLPAAPAAPTPQTVGVRSKPRCMQNRPRDLGHNLRLCPGKGPASGPRAAEPTAQPQAGRQGGLRAPPSCAARRSGAFLRLLLLLRIPHSHPPLRQAPGRPRSPEQKKPVSSSPRGHGCPDGLQHDGDALSSAGRTNKTHRTPTGSTSQRPAGTALPSKEHFSSCCSHGISSGGGLGAGNCTASAAALRQGRGGPGSGPLTRMAGHRATCSPGEGTPEAAWRGHSPPAPAAQAYLRRRRQSPGRRTRPASARRWTARPRPPQRSRREPRSPWPASPARSP